MLLPLLRISDVSINKQRVHLWMHILHCNLEPIEAPGFCDLHFLWESLNQILIDNAIGGCEESQDVLDEMTLTVL